MLGVEKVVSFPSLIEVNVALPKSVNSADFVIILGSIPADDKSCISCSTFLFSESIAL
jgi:hypothetical protein